MDWNKEVTFVASKKAELKVQKREKNLWWWRVASKHAASGYLLFTRHFIELDTTIHNLSISIMKLSIAALLVTYASAFAPASHTKGPSALDAVSKKDTYDVTLLPGDGIGPEITEATTKVLGALCKRCGFELNLKEALIGGAAIDEKNDPFPDESLQQCLASDSVLLACIGGYKWDTNPRELRPETGLLKMRKTMGLFANLRPAKVLEQLIDASTLKREIIEGVDVMVVRELTGDVYFGTPKGIDVIDGKFH